MFALTRPIVLLSLILGSSLAAEPTAPDWPRDAIFYQIYPERFRNGDPTNDPTPAEVEENANWKPSPWTSDWYQLQEWEKSRNSVYRTINSRRYGGDLQGLIDKLDYLKKLGINAIYLNPIFEAFSHHKYDGSSFHHIDNNFGPDSHADLELFRNDDFTATNWPWSAADKLFLKTIQEAHKRQIRVVIDGVFNHVGTRFPPFQDVLKNQGQSKYTNWFNITKWDDPATPRNEFDYKAWWNYKSLPEFRKDENGLVAGPRQYVFAITRRWMDPNGDGDPSDGVDGWRLDVAGDIPHPFWKDWRKHVKAINPTALIIGELWDDASAWLQGDEFDSVMNYRFAKAAVRFFIDNDARHLNVTAFDKELANIRQSYPARLNYLLLNLYDSHDTDRIASMVKNPNRKYDDKANPQNNREYDITKPTAADRQAQKLLSLFQLTYLGAPMIYYGTEAGMWGADDPDDRKPMLWQDMEFQPESTHPQNRPRNPDANKFDPEMFGWYQTLIRIRSEEPALRRGDFKTILTDDEKQTYAFQRTYENSSVTVILNSSASQRLISLKATAVHRDVLTQKTHNPTNGELQLSIPAKSGAILKRIQ